MRLITAFALLAAVSAGTAMHRNRNAANNVVMRRKQGAKQEAAAKAAVPKPRRAQIDPAGVLVWTRFNCAFPFCPTTALDVCSMDEHFELNRPWVIATLIPQTETAQMNFFAYSDYDANTRLHYTLAARTGPTGQPLNQLFTTYVAPNVTAGYLANTVAVSFPANCTQDAIVYLHTSGGSVFITFAGGEVLQVDPTTGAISAVFDILADPDSTLTYASAFDAATGIFYSNAVRASEGTTETEFFLVKFTASNGAVDVVGPLPPAPGTADPNGNRADNALATLVTYPPFNTPATMVLVELRNSEYDPFLWLSFLDPVSGNSTVVPFDDDEWYLSWEVDPQIYPDQWAGSQRRVWSYDPVNAAVFFKMYDECGGETDDCDEDETVVHVQLNQDPTVFNTYWTVDVEPIEPELTQMIWVANGTSTA